jgi:hypothetical protein
MGQTIKLRKDYGTHLPILMRLVAATSGSVLELGAGPTSTPFLHWWCVPFGRTVETFEDVDFWFDFAKQYEEALHPVNKVIDWEETDLAREWDVVLVDHNHHPRGSEAKRVATWAKFVVLHDTDSRDEIYKYEEVYPFYKYAFRPRIARPRTTVLSNFLDPGSLDIWGTWKR